MSQPDPSPHAAGDEYLRALIAAGVLPPHTTAAVIVARWREPVQVHIETLASAALLDVVVAGLHGAAQVVQDEPRVIPDRAATPLVVP